MSDWTQDWADSVDKSLPQAATSTPAPSAPAKGSLTYNTGGDPFERSVQRTLGFEGGLNKKDTNGTPSKYGINAAANPDVDLGKLTPDGAKKIYKSRYWDTIGGDHLAQIDPNLAHVAFDTSVIAGPGKAKELIAQSGGDPAKLLQLRAQFQDHLLAKDPEKYGPYTKAWADRISGLAQDVATPQGAPQVAPAEGDLAPDLTKDFRTSLAATLGKTTPAPPAIFTRPGVSGIPSYNYQEPVLADKDLPPWGPVQNVAAHALGGKLADLGPKLMAGVAAAKGAYGEYQGGASPSQALSSAQNFYYPQALSQYKEAQQGYETSPLTSGQGITTGIAGDLLPIGVGTGLVNAGIGAGARAIGAAAPSAAPAVTEAANYLMGTGGEGIGGARGWAARRASDVIGGGIQGGVADALTGENPLSGAAFGGLSGGVLGALGARALSAPSRVTMLPETAKAAKAYGENLPVAALTGDKLVQALAGMGDRESIEQFNKKILAETGAEPFAAALGKKGIDSDVFKATKDALSAGYDSFGQTARANWDGQLVQDLQKVFNDAKNDLGKTRIESVKTLVKEMKTIAGAPRIDANGQKYLGGNDFLSITKPGGALDTIYEADDRLTPYASRIKEALRGALGRTDPSALAEVSALDRHWGNLRQLEPAISNLDDGLMSPQRVAQVMKKKTGSLADIADIGKYLPVPQASGEVKGKNTLGAAKLGGTLLGASAFGQILAEHGTGLLHHAAEHPFAVGAGLAGAGAISAAKNAYGNWLRSPEYFNKVVEQSLSPTSHYAINPLTAIAPTWTQSQ